MGEAYIVAAVRTAGGKRGGKLKDWHPVDLGAQVIDALLDRSGANPDLIEDVICGWGNDWISGGTGQDGVLGDDGRLFTSRNTAGNAAQFSEPLYGINFLLATDPDTKFSNGNVIDEFDVIGRRQWLAHKPRLDLRAGIRGKRCEQGIGAFVDQWIAVLHRYRKACANADIACRARNLGGFRRQVSQRLRARVMDHHGAGAAKRAVGKRQGCGEIGIHGGKQREVMQP